jgi:hypothetical protein
MTRKATSRPIDFTFHIKKKRKETKKPNPLLFTSGCWKIRIKRDIMKGKKWKEFKTEVGDIVS